MLLSDVPSPRDHLAQRLRDLLSTYPSLREVHMFGGLSFMVEDRIAVAAGRDGTLLVRTDPAEYDRLLRQGGEPAFMGHDRPMGRGWLTVPRHLIEDDADLAAWVKIGIDSHGTTS